MKRFRSIRAAVLPPALFLALLALPLLAVSRLLLAAGLDVPRQSEEPPVALWTPVPAAGRQADGGLPELLVLPGNETEAKDYYIALRKDHLVQFTKPTLEESRIADMLAYLGVQGYTAEQLESLAPAELNEDGKILAVRFFAPKIVDVRKHEVPPTGGYGWRKIVRLQAQKGSPADKDEIDAFYLLFNFASTAPAFPQGQHAGQIQAMLVPRYGGKAAHRDAYFLVYQPLNAPNPGDRGKVGFFLTASFDLAGVVKDDRYYVPRSCAQCHGTTDSKQKGAKVNYLDTDHWLDRAGDSDFPQMPKENVLVDGPSSYAAFRAFNLEVRQQNQAVIQPGQPKFALLAAEKWLALHGALHGALQGEDAPYAGKHAPLPARAFGSQLWKGTASPDKELLPLLNQYCFRCHSSVAFHVFDRAEVLGRKAAIGIRIPSSNDKIRMPQDRQLGATVKEQMKNLVTALAAHQPSAGGGGSGLR